MPQQSKPGARRAPCLQNKRVRGRAVQAFDIKAFEAFEQDELTGRAVGTHSTVAAARGEMTGYYGVYTSSACMATQVT